MRIVLLSDCWHPVRNGVVHHVALLARALEVNGFAVKVITPGPKHAADEPFVLRYEGLPLGATGYFAGWPMDSTLRKTLLEAQLLHTHHPFQSGAVAWHAARQSGAPLVFTSHTRYDVYLEAFVPWLPKEPAQIMVREALRTFTQHCAAVIAPSAGAAQVIQGWGVRAPISVIPNGIEVERFAAARADQALRRQTRAALELAPDAVVSLFVGRLSAEKRVLPLLESFAAARRAGAVGTLLLVGTGAQEEKVRAAVQRLGIAAAVRVAGARPYAEVPALFAAADLFVSAAVSEGHPLTFLEAAAAGLPALGHASPGISDTIIDGVTGLLAPPPTDSGPDPAFVACWLALAESAAERAQMGAAAALHAQNFSAAATADRVHALYRTLLPAEPGAGPATYSRSQSGDILGTHDS